MNEWVDDSQPWLRKPKSKSELILVTGANRQRKTTGRLKYVHQKEGPLVCISRTINNLESSLQTFKKYVDTGNEYYNTLLAGAENVCPEFDKDDKTAHGIKKVIHCHKCVSIKQRGVDHDDYSAIAFERDMDGATAKRFFDDFDICPRATLKLHIKAHRQDKQVIFTPYAGLKNIDLSLFDGAYVILDEARHIPDILSIIYQKRLYKPSTMSSDKIVDKYIEFVKTNTTFPEPKRQRLLNELVSDWCDYVFEVHRAHMDAKNEEAKGVGCPDKDGLYVGEKIIRNVKKPSFRGALSLSKELKTHIKSNPGDWNLSRLYLLLEAMAFARKEDSLMNLDYTTNSDKKNTVCIKIREMDGLNESRKLIQEIIKRANKVFLIDSTPFPEEFYPFWFGADSVDDTTDVDLDYEFNVVVEGVNYSLKNVWGGKRTAETMVKKIRGIRDRIDGELHIFSRSHREKDNLKSHGIDNAKVARGTEVEGVQLEGYTLSTGFPLQNIRSEEYRKYDLARMTGLEPNEAIKQYRKIKACQELIQQSFRTANNASTSGSVWLGINKEVLAEVKENWRWLEKINFVVLPAYLRVEDKIKYIVQGLTTGAIPEYTETELKIKGRIIEILKGSKNKSEYRNNLVENVIGKNRTIREVIRRMKAEGIVKEKIVCKFPVKKVITLEH